MCVCVSVCVFKQFCLMDGKLIQTIDLPQFYVENKNLSGWRLELQLCYSIIYYRLRFDHLTFTTKHFVLLLRHAILL